MIRLRQPKIKGVQRYQEQRYNASLFEKLISAISAFTDKKRIYEYFTKSQYFQELKNLTLERNSYSSRIPSKQKNNSSFPSSLSRRENMNKSVDFLFSLVKSCLSLMRLQGVLLAINFNFPHYSIIPLLKSYYAPIFGKVVFCGATESKQYGVIEIKENKGFQGYLCIAMAMKLYPGYDGYIHTNDDVLINWWNLQKLDSTKIWTGSIVNFEKGYVLGQPIPKGWHWWRTGNNAKLCENVIHEIIINKHEIIDTNQYYKNMKNIPRCINGWSDFFYIPKHFAEMYAHLAELFGKKNIFLEVAVPTMLSFFLNETNFLNLEGMYLNGLYGYSKTYLSGKAFYERYTVDLFILHPFKLDGAMKKANINIFKNVIMSYGENIVKNMCSII